MIHKKKIRIVKRSDAAAAKAAKKSKTASPRIAAREIVSTVSEWVSDLRDRKSGETRAAIDLLFSVNQRPNES